MNYSKTNENRSLLPLWKALLPIFLLVVLLTFNVVVVFGEDALNGSNQFILLLVSGITMLLTFTEGIPFYEIMNAIKLQLSSVTEALLILLMVGALSGTWLLSGIIPTMVYYGLQLLSAEIFLVACVVIAIIVSLATGSSWTTSATVGIALIGIAKTLDISLGMTAGALLSGAYFGDKLSPLSDTTNLASSLAGANLFSHIKYMLWTTIPSIIITILFFTIAGFTLTIDQNVDNSQLLLDLKRSFIITPWLLLMPLIIVFLIIKKVPALISLFIGALLGGILAIIIQPQAVLAVSGLSELSVISAYKGVFIALTESIQINTKNELLKDLFSSNGMSGMLGTVWLIICAMVLGGALQALGALERISGVIIKTVASTGGLIASAVGVTIVTNFTASDQYLALVVPAKMFKKPFENKQLAPENLSRTLEDSGTVTSVLVPWNTCGAYHANTLGVDVIEFAAFAIFNWLSPLMTLIFAIGHLKIKRTLVKP